ncbi:protein phosphatase PTC7 homolog isoform X1 [Drosophila gunungcola]|uniref:protein phosphatase PTC7 homolog isoform X1 n=1 Tax=Drosophila gunungcola TaxID=103775 RepID=UPI0022E09774|nr:protein phosphatase PTC7 homolog isoform X1 [Drosophila gunungcola]
MNTLDVDFRMDIRGTGFRRTIQQYLINCCAQLVEIAMILTHESGKFMCRLWGGTSQELPPNGHDKDDDGDKGHYHCHRTTNEKKLIRNSGGEGDFQRLPRLVSVACGFAKDQVIYPHYSRGKFGEDAWFSTSNAQAYTMGVADGVGGWRSFGVDPGEFSMFLMRSCERLSLGKDMVPQRPDLLLARAYCELLGQKCPVVGSCTACILILNRANSTLYTANLGDSGFLVVRSGAVACRSLEQQHHFNTPYQLSASPPRHHVTAVSDGPESADTMQFTVEPGDVILLATDGVYDNVPESILIEVLSEMSGVSDAVRLQMAANAVALMARILSFNPAHDSPFSQNARKLNIAASGGKPDDITVLLATVV